MKGSFLNTKSITVLSIIASLLYLYLMFLEPFLSFGSVGLIKTLKDWQTLNSAIIALIASAIALYANQYSEKKQKERDFIAAKAFLPDALSELNGYLKKSAKIYLEIYEFKKNKQVNVKLSNPLAELPNNYKIVFRDCIHSGESSVGIYLSEFLRKLQVHNSRMAGTYINLGDSENDYSTLESVSTDILNTAELYAMLGRLFPFSRNESELNISKLKPAEINIGYPNLKIDPTEIIHLEEQTSRY